jgi:hypothetical protein
LKDFDPVLHQNISEKKTPMDIITRIQIIAIIVGVIGFSTCIKTHPEIVPPIVSDLVINPNLPLENEDITISIKVSDISGIKNINLMFRVNDGSYVSTTMSPTTNTEIYTGHIPAQLSGITISFYIEAENSKGAKTLFPVGAPNTTISFTVSKPIPKTIELTPLTRLPSILLESSGIAITTPGKIWSHNDSGNENKLYCINSSGILLRTITVSNATNTDWEDLAVDSQKRIYIGDTGNNANDRRNLAFFRIPNPETFTGNSVSAEIINYTFEDQTAYPPPSNSRNYDVEATIWFNDSIFMFTKDRTSPFAGHTKLYKIPAIPGNHIAKLAGSLFLGTTTASARVTGADIHPESGKVVLLVQERVILFDDYTGSNFFSGKKYEYKFKTLPGQIEAIHFKDENTLYITEEGSNSTAGFLFQTTLPSSK